MDPARLLRRRARAQAGLLALVGLLGALVTATLVGTFGYVGLAARDGLASALREADPQAAALQGRTRLSDDAGAQQDAATEVLGAVLGDLPVVVHRSARSLTLQASAADGSVLGPVVAGGDASLTDRASVVDGSWPDDSDGSGAVPAALPVDAAAALALAVGDEVVLSGDSRSTPLTVRVAALWQPADPDDPSWFGDQVDLAGSDGVVTGPFVLRDADLADVPAMVLVRWTLVPDPAVLTPEQLPALRTALAAVPDALHEDDTVNRQGVAVEGTLGATLGEVDRTLTAVRGVSTAAALLTVLVGLVVLGQLARLLVEVRTAETVLLRSRGVTVARAARWAAVEALAVLAAGALAGSVVAALVLRRWGAVPVGVAVTGALGVVLVGTALLAGTAAARAARALRPGRAAGAGAAGGALVLAVAVTAVAVWRLTDLGSPVVLGADGRSAVDPVAAAAVPFALVLVALLAAGVLVPLARVRARAAARRRDLGPVLAARQVVRRPTAHAASAVLVALTVAITVFVGTYVGTWQAQRGTSAAVASGADLRIDLGDHRAVAEASDPADVAAAGAAAEVAAVPGVAAAVPVRTGSAALGGVQADLVALPSAELGAVLLPAAAAPDLDEIAPEDALPGAALPAGAATVRLAATVAGTQGTPETGDDAKLAGVEAVVWVAAGPGSLTRVTLVPDATAGTWSADLPPAPDADPWRVVAVDLRVPTSFPYRAAVTGLTADGTDVLGGAAGWSAWLLSTDPTEVTGTGAGLADVGVIALEGRSGAPLRYLPPDPGPVPVVVTEALAAGLALEPGDTSSVRFAGRDVPVRVAATVPVVPGVAGGGGLLVDLDLLDAALLRGGQDVPRVAEVWAAAPGRAATADAVLAALASPTDPDRAVTVTTADPEDAPLSRPSLVVFWLAAAGALVLAIGGVAAAARALGRERDGEIGVLRALGVGAAAQARSRAAELAGSAAVAAVVGLLGGAAVAAVGARTLVTATTGGGAAGPLAVAPLGVGLLLGAAALGVAVVVLDAARRVRVRAQDAPVRQEAQQ